MYNIIAIIFIVLLLWYMCVKKIEYNCTIQTKFRELWVDHGIYTRLYIVSFLENSPATAANAQRLMKNQEDIGNTVSQLYGNRKGDPLIIVLKAHIAGAVQILKDLKGSNCNLKNSIAAWYQNGNDLAMTLHKINPNWNLDGLQKMIKKHLDLTIQESQQYFAGQYDLSIQTFDQVMKELMMMSDSLT